MNFSVGDKVYWESQSGGYWKTKTGTIVYILSAREEPSEAWQKCNSGGRFVYGGGIRRRETSYFVKVGNKVYWPLVSQLRPVEVSK